MIRCSPKTGQHIEYAGKVTQESNDRIKLSLYVYMAGGGCMVDMFLRKANFSLLQRNKFYLTIMVVVKH